MNDLKILISDCKHLKEISCYNHNYYLLPDGIEIEGCNVVKEICDEDYDDYTYIIGTLEEGPFKDDGNHTRFPTYQGFDVCCDYLFIELDRKNEYNT